MVVLSAPLLFRSFLIAYMCTRQHKYREWKLITNLFTEEDQKRKPSLWAFFKPRGSIGARASLMAKLCSPFTV